MWRFVSVRVASRSVAVLVLAATVAIAELAAQTGSTTVPVPIPGRNINMVSGATFPDGDPFLQRQNEPSIAVSTRNPLHLFGAANDYRTVDIPGLVGEVNGDAWIGIFKSFDGGSTWRSTLLPGFPLDGSPQGATSPLKGLEAGADPVVRSGTNGLFYLAGIGFNRASSADGKVFVARYIDNNNLEAGDPIQYLGTSVVEVGTATRFLDKPWIAVDIPRAGNGNNGRANGVTGNGNDKGNNGNGNGNGGSNHASFPTCQIPGQAKPVPAGPIYVMYSAFISPSTTSTGSSSNDDNDGGRGRYRRPRRLHDWDGDRGRDRDTDDHDHDEHQPGQPMEGRTQLMFARSLDCGATFSQPTQISDRTQINQGSVAAIDPNTGDIYVAWREFLSSAQPDAILVTKSTDFGASFSDPVTVARITPFDQSTSSTRFRTNAYPAMTVDADGRVYIAWSQRNVGPYGDARIVISSSSDGRRWTAPVPVDNHGGHGHQFMPVLSSSGGKLHLVFWDQRDDVSGVWESEIDDATALASHATGATGPKLPRHTIDLYAIAATPGNPPQFGASKRLSDYPRGSRSGSKTVEQMQFNAPNLPLFAQGTVPFIGDYLDVSVSPTFIANGDGSWRYNTLSSDPAVYFASWSDNRDVRAPSDGNWTHYTAPTFGLTANAPRPSVFDPSQLVMCTPGQAGMRNQNVYSTRVSTGLVATIIGNTKPLGTVDGRLIQRTFVASVSNPDSTRKSVILHIPSQPVGGHASFLQFAPLTDLPVMVEAKSSIAREVFVTSTDRTASIAVTVEDSTTHTIAAELVINPDPTNPDIQNPDIQNPDIQNPDIQNAEVHAVTVSNPDIQNPDIQNPDIQNPDIQNPDIQNPDIQNPDIQNQTFANPDIINPDIQNPDIQNPDIQNPDIQNPDIQNPDIQNRSLTDVTWNVNNVGNTATSYQVKVLLDQAAQARLLAAGVAFQLIITKNAKVPVVIDQCLVAQPSQNITVAAINNPGFTDPSKPDQLAKVVNPDIQNPDIQNTTVALNPGETARVTLRVFSPTGDTGTAGTGTGSPDALFTGALEDLNKVGVVTTSHPVDTADANNNITTPQVTASIPLIVTTTLPDGTRLSAYSAALEQTGATAPFTFSLASGAMPPGVSINAAGLITGTPGAAGTYTFSILLKDANQLTATANLTIRVFEPILVAATTLTEAAVNQPYTTNVAATGGFAPYGWALSAGTLPAGLTLSPAGVVTGTPTQSGVFTLTASATDAAFPSQIGSGPITLNVAPAANPQTVSLLEDAVTPITLTGTGAAPAAFSFAIGLQPLHGTVTLNGAVATYKPATNYNGADSFTFRVSQNGLTSGFATVSLNVAVVNDAPVANPQTVSTPVSTAKSITLTGTDAEGSALTYSVQSNPQHGSISGGTGAVRTYTPANGYQGPDAFTFRVNDGTQNSANATVTIEVGPPLATWADVTATLTDSPDPVALGSNVVYTAQVHNNGPAAATGVTLTLAYSTADFNLVSVAPASAGCAGMPMVCSLGTLANGATVTVTLTLKAANRGSVTLATTATVASTTFDYNTANGIATQTTTVTGSATPTADLSITQSGPATVPFGGNADFNITVTNNGPSNATGVMLTSTFPAAKAAFVNASGSQGLCSTAAGQVTCSIGSVASGDSVTYTLTYQAKGSGSIANAVTVTGTETDTAAANNSVTTSVAVNNRTPIATDDVATTNEDTPTTIAVLANDTDPDGDTLTISAITQPAGGTVLVNGNNTVTFSPSANFNGPASFTYTANDGHGGTATATVSVNVIAVNDAPSFVKGSNVTVARSAGPQAINGWATAISRGPADESSQQLNFIVGNDNHALFSVQPNVTAAGALTFTPLATATPGTATVTVWLQDDGGTANGGVDTSAAQTFTITTIANSAPAVTDDSASTNQNTAVIIPVLNNDTDADHDALQIVSIVPPLNGSAIPNGAATTITYTPANNFAGVDSFQYQVTDGHGGDSQLATVTVTVNATGPAHFVVTNTDDSGPGSLRAAILNANENPGADTILFRIPGAGVQTIAPSTPLPGLTDTVVVQGLSQGGAGYTGPPLVELDGSGAGPNADGLMVTAGPATIEGLVINRFSRNGITIVANGVVVRTNYIGVGADGATPRGNAVDGVSINGAPNFIGSALSEDRNVISGNGRDGVWVANNSAPGNAIVGNYIGVDLSGDHATPNSRNGVTVQQTNTTIVGGTTAGEMNVISGNGVDGVWINYCDPNLTCGGHTISGNRIGTNAAGTAAIPNGQHGVEIYNAPNNTVRANVIAGNTLDGVNVFSTPGDPQAETHFGNNVVAGNLIGLNAAGNAPLPNQRHGITFAGPTASRIGGLPPIDRNIIAGNLGAGVSFDQTTHNTITNNYIGVLSDGSTAAGNHGSGITLQNSPNNTIGGAGLLTGNLILANFGHGVGLNQSDNNTIQGNSIGVGIGGVALGNGLNNDGSGGIGIAASNGTQVVKNTVAYSHGNGIGVNPGTGNRISQNQIFSNAGLGIDLGPSGVTPNDAGDADTGGNNLQNFPVISAAINGNTSTTVLGTLNSTPNRSFTVELFSSVAADPSGYGEGQQFVGSFPVTTDGSGNAPFTFQLATPALVGAFVTATATDASGNTSEFSLARAVVANHAPTATNDAEATLSGQSATMTPTANDIDADNTSPQLLATVRGMPAGVPSLFAPGEMAVVNSTGLGYFASSALQLGVFDTAANAITGTIPWLGLPAPTSSAVNQSTHIVYFRAGNTLAAVDGRPGSPTFNQVILADAFAPASSGTILQSIVIDETRNLLYATSGGGQTAITIVDVNPDSPTFHQQLASVPIAGVAAPRGVAVNTLTNQIYVGTTSGLFVMDGVTRAVSAIANTPGSVFMPVVNETLNLVYATASGNLVYAIDGATNTRIAAILLSGTAGNSPFDRRIALHKASGRVYVRTSDFPNSSTLYIIDGDSASATYNTIVTQFALGRENGAYLAVDQAAGLVVATSNVDFNMSVIKVATDTIVASFGAAQPRGPVVVGPNHRAFVTGGIGLISGLNLSTFAQLPSVQSYEETVFPIVDTNAHVAFVPETGLTTDVAVIDATGRIGTVNGPHGDGRYIYGARNATTNTIYVENNSASIAGGQSLPGFVSVIDGATRHVTANVPAGANPFGIGIDETRNKVYIANINAGTSFPGGITILDGATNSTTTADMSQIPLQPNFVTAQISVTRTVVPNPTTGKVYFLMSNAAVSTIGVLDPVTHIATGLPAALGPVTAIQVNPLLNRVYVASSQGGLHVLNGANDQEIATLAVGSPTVLLGTSSYLAVNKTTGRLYVGDFNNDRVFVIDGSTNAVVGTLSTGRGPSSVAVNESANRVYVANALDKTISIINGATLRVEATIPVPLHPYYLAVDESASRIYAAGGCPSGNTVCSSTETGTMVISDPGSPAQPLSIISVTQGAHGSVALNGDGSVTYTSNGNYSGPDSYSYTMSDGNGGTATGTVNVTVVPALAITTPLLPSATVGTSYSQPLTATGGSTPYTWQLASGQLPSGLLLDSSGVVSGTPTQSGNFNFTAQVRDAVGGTQQTVNASFNVVTGPLSILTTGLNNATIGSPYSATLAAGGSAATPFTWSIISGALPAGLSLSSAGAISGTPNPVDCTTANFTVQVVDSTAPTPQTATRAFSLFVTGTVRITTTSPGPGIVLNSGFGGGVNASCGNGTRTWSLESGSLPLGVTFPGGNQNFFSGTPKANGNFPVSIKVSDSSGSDTKTVTLVSMAIDQSPSSSASTNVSTTSRVAQTITAAANGQLTAIGLPGQLFCSSPVSMTIEGVDGTNKPNDANILSGAQAVSFTGFPLVVPVSTPFPIAAGTRFAVVMSMAANSCSLTNGSNNDVYPNGGVFTNNGSSWVAQSFPADLPVQSFVNGVLDQNVVTGVTLNVTPTQRVAQTLTTGVTGQLTGLRFSNQVGCSAPMTLTIEGVNAASGQPDDSQVLVPGFPVSFGSPQVISLPNAIFRAADEPFAIVFSSTGSCGINNASTTDIYSGGAAFTSSGATWSAASNFDVSVQSLVQNANLLSLFQSNGQTRTVALSSTRVLAVGSQGLAQVIDTAAAGTALPTVVTMVSQRNDASVTRLSDGRVLVTGGTFNGAPLGSAEIFDPAGNGGLGSFTATAGTMAQGRSNHTATLLTNGQVLIAGGFSNTPLPSAYLFNPATGQFTPTGTPLNVARHQHRATLLGNGKVLITGGFGNSPSAELFDPAANGGAGGFTTTAALLAPRAQHTATLLNDGTVLLAGGVNTFGSSNMVATGELYTPGTGAFTPAGSMINPRQLHTATVLADGSVLLTGGLRSNNFNTAPWASAERYVPGTGFVGAPAAIVTRNNHGAELLGNGRVAIVGGFAPSQQASQSFEIYDAGATPTGTPSIANPNLPDGSLNASYAPATLIGIGGTGPYTFAIVAPSALPPGLTLSDAVVSGTPTAAGVFSTAVQIVDANAHGNIQTIRTRISALDIITTSLPTAYVNRSYQQQLVATGVGAKTWSLFSGTMPPGLSVDSNMGLVVGTPTALGFFNFTVRAIDSIGQTATAPLTIQVTNALTITTATLGDATATQTYSTCIGTSNGTGPFNFALSGAVPLGMALKANGCFDSSFPAHQLLQAGTFPLTVTVTDSSLPPQTDFKTYTLRVHAQDQNSFFGPANPAVSLPPTRQVAQVFTSGTAFDLSGVQLQGLSSCAANTQITATIRPVTGSPAYPDESVAALGSTTVAANGSGFFPFLATFSTPIPMPQHARYAVVLSFTGGSCTGSSWPTTDSYPAGDGWVNDGSSWVLASTAIGRSDVPMSVVVLPPTQTTLTFLNAYRANHASVTLQDGRILILGTDGTAEIYDPAALPVPTLVPTAGPMTAARNDRPTATLLPNGKVLITGGFTQTGGQTFSLATTELFDPANGGTFTAGGTMAQARTRHQATLLANGKVLITGGWFYDGNNQTQTLQSAELLDASGASVASLPMNGARADHAATRLLDGKVLLTGGWRGNVQTSAEVYNPAIGANGTFTTVGPMVLWRASHTSTLITTGPQAGQVLIAGGYGDYPALAASTEFFDPGTSAFTSGPVMTSVRAVHTATAMLNGDIVIAGGNVDWFTNLETSSIDVFSANAGTISAAGDMTVDRAGATAERLTIGPNQGKVLVAGGSGVSTLTSRTVEILDPSSNGVVITTTNLPDGQAGHPYLTSPMSASGGTGTGYVFTLASGQLPPSPSGPNQLVLASNGVLQGQLAANASGVWSFVVKVTDSGAHVAYRRFVIVVDRLDITSSSPLPSGVVGASYSEQLTASSPGTTWTLFGGILPPGLTLAANGLISGTPTTVSFNFITVRVADTTGQAAVKSFSLNVQSPMTITTASLPAGTVQNSYFGCVNSIGGTGTTTWSIAGGVPPPGLTIASYGCFGGAPLPRTGPYTFTVRVQDGDTPPQSATRQYTLRVGATDQNGPSVENGVLYAIHSSQQVAQTFRQTMTGGLLAVQASIACTVNPGQTFTLSIRPVDGLGRIDMNGAPLSSENFDVATVPDFNGSPFLRTLTLSSPVFAPIGVRLAAVFSTTSASCNWYGSPATGAGGFDYAFGDAFIGTGGPVTWTKIRTLDPSRPDLPFNTIVDPNDALDFMPNNNGRASHTATVLSDGRVLLAGGWATFGSTALLYDESARTFSNTTGQMNGFRQYHTATTLSNGKVLLIGGRDPQTGLARNDAETYDPSTQTFTPLPATMAQARWYHTATMLNDGRILITGGETAWDAQLSSTEIFDPSNGTFTAGPAMAGTRSEHTATLLSSGVVLIVGGFGNYGGATAEKYIPGTPGSFFPPTLQPTVARASHTATVLNSGKVLLAGGWVGGATTATAEIYDPGGDVFSSTGSLTTSGAHHSAALLSNGDVLIAGGDVESGDSLARLEIYNPTAGTFTPANFMTVPRSSLTASVLSDGKVLLAGGYGGSNASGSSAERFDPAVPRVYITNPDLPDGYSNTNYAATLNASVGGTTMTMTSGSLPPGVSFSNGVVSGQPSQAGAYYFGVHVFDPVSGQSVDQTIRLRIDALDITTTFLPEGQVGVPYSTTLAATHAATWVVASNNPPLPTGLSLDSNGTLHGTPTQTSTDSSVFVATDALGQQTTRRLYLHIIGNHAPQALNDNVNVGENVTLNQPAPGVLQNDSDSDSAPLTVSLVTAPLHGTVVMNSNGGFTYTPALDYVGLDSFTYKANDGYQDSNLATVSLSVNPVTVYVPGDYGTIQAAINGAPRSATIYVAAGTYYTNLVWNNKPLTIVGAAAATTIVDGQTISSVLKVNNVPATGSISGFTFKKGNADAFIAWTVWGGGALLQNSPITISDSVFTSNQAGGGAGISLWSSDATILRTTLIGNSATGEGGGLDAQQSSPLVQNSTISGNTPSGLSSFNNNGQAANTVGPTLVNTLVTGNINSDWRGGAGIGIWGSKLALINTTVTANQNGGVFEADPVTNTVTITNSILSGNTGQSDLTAWTGAGMTASQANVTYSIVGTGSFTAGTGTTSVDPQFVNAGAQNYRLAANSPAINAGTNSAVAFPYDLDGNPRIVDTTVDQGAYENQTGSSTTLIGPGGGGGGAPFGPDYCATGIAAAGFVVNGDWTYALTAGALYCGDNTLTPKFGGAPTPNVNLFCNPGDKMVGFFGTHGDAFGNGSDVVTSVGADCLPSGGGAIYSTAAAPGGGNPFGPFDCPVGKAVVGVQGGNGAVVDRIQLICKVP